MAEPAELGQETVVRFLAERGGRARHEELREHFRGWLSPPEPERRAAARQRFKELVNAVATVRQEPDTGAKYVCLRRRYCVPGAAGAVSPEAAAAAAEGSAERPSPPPSPRADAEREAAAGGDAGGRAEPEGRREEATRPSQAAGGGQRKGSRRGPAAGHGGGGGEEAVIATE